MKWRWKLYRKGHWVFIDSNDYAAIRGENGRFSRTSGSGPRYRHLYTPKTLMLAALTQPELP
jgi:hypothetical protein